MANISWRIAYAQDGRDGDVWQRQQLRPPAE